MIVGQRIDQSAIDEIAVAIARGGAHDAWYRHRPCNGGTQRTRGENRFDAAAKISGDDLQWNVQVLETLRHACGPEGVKKALAVEQQRMRDAGKQPLSSARPRVEQATRESRCGS